MVKDDSNLALQTFAAGAVGSVGGTLLTNAVKGYRYSRSLGYSDDLDAMLKFNRHTGIPSSNGPPLKKSLKAFQEDALAKGLNEGQVDELLGDMEADDELARYLMTDEGRVRAWEKLKKTALRTNVDTWLPAVSMWIDEGYEFVQTSAGLIVKSNGDEVVEIAGDIAKWTKHKVVPEPNSSIIRTADEVNPGYEGWDPPYHSDYPAVDFKPSSDEAFVRVFKDGVNNAEGAFVMKQSDITGLTPAQIKDKFALDNIPDKIVDVNAPAGTSMRTGKVAPRPNGTAGGAIQFELREQIASSNFTNIRDL